MEHTMRIIVYTTLATRQINWFRAYRSWAGSKNMLGIDTFSRVYECNKNEFAQISKKPVDETRVIYMFK